MNVDVLEAIVSDWHADTSIGNCVISIAIIDDTITVEVESTRSLDRKLAKVLTFESLLEVASRSTATRTMNKVHDFICHLLGVSNDCDQFAGIRVREFQAMFPTREALLSGTKIGVSVVQAVAMVMSANGIKVFK